MSRREERTSFGKHKHGILATTIACIAILMVITMHFTICLPIYLEYHKEYGAHKVMAYNQATFEGIEEQITIIQNKINETFYGRDYDTIYNSPWWWHCHYARSLQAQVDYLEQIQNRIDSYISDYASMKGNTSKTYLKDWYDESINNLRTEMKEHGGLDWILNDAWLLTFYPNVYWTPYIGWAVFIALIIVAISLYLYWLYWLDEWCY